MKSCGRAFELVALVAVGFLGALAVLLVLGLSAFFMIAAFTDDDPVPDDDATDHPSDAAPVWSPDAGRIAFIRTDADFRSMLRVTSVSDDEHRELLESVGPHASLPAWSPDGTRLAVASPRDGVRGTACFSPPCSIAAELYLISTDSGRRRRLTHNSSEDLSPAWSPDGTKLAFVSGRDRPKNRRSWRDVYILDLATGETSRVTSDAQWEQLVSWTSDGGSVVAVDDEGGQRRLPLEGVSETLPPARTGARGGSIEEWLPGPAGVTAFTTTADRNGESCYVDSGPPICRPNSELYLVVDGRRIRVTRTKEDETALAWSRQGASLVFASGEELWLVRAHGGGLRRLTDPD